MYVFPQLTSIQQFSTKSTRNYECISRQTWLLCIDAHRRREKPLLSSIFRPTFSNSLDIKLWWFFRTRCRSRVIYDFHHYFNHQLPAICESGLSIVVSPLISLIQGIQSIVTLSSVIWRSDLNILVLNDDFYRPSCYA